MVIEVTVIPEAVAFRYTFPDTGGTTEDVALVVELMWKVPPMAVPAPPLHSPPAQATVHAANVKLVSPRPAEMVTV